MTASMMHEEERIARITDTFLGWEDHNIFTAWLTFDYGDGGVQGGGMYMLSHTVKGSYNPVTKDYTYCGAPKGIEHIMRIMRACGVSEWGKLKGRTVFVIIDGGTIRGIKPLPTEGGQEFVFADLDIWEGHKDH